MTSRADIWGVAALFYTPIGYIATNDRNEANELERMWTNVVVES